MPGAGGYWGQAKPPAGVGINFSHPLADGLVFCLNFAEGNGIPRDVVYGRQGTPSTNIPWTVRHEGRGPLFDHNSQKKITYSMGKTIASGPCTVVVDIRMDSRSTSSFVVIGSVDGNDQLMHIQYFSSTDLDFNLFADDLAVNPSGFTADGDRNFIVCRLNPSKKQDIILNGRLMGSKTSSSFYIGNQTLTIGSRPDNSVPTGGVYNGVWVYNRYLTDTECQNLYGAPWQMFEAPIWKEKGFAASRLLTAGVS